MKEHSVFEANIVLEHMYHLYSNGSTTWYIERSAEFRDNVNTYFQVKDKYENLPDKRTSEARKLRDTMSNLEHIINENM